MNKKKLLTIKIKVCIMNIEAREYIYKFIYRTIKTNLLNFKHKIYVNYA